MKRRIICLIMAFVLILSVLPAAGAAEFEKIRTYEGQFSDIPTDQWYAEYVSLAYEMGLMNGISEDCFNPDGNISVAEAIALAARLHSISSGKNAQFTQGTVWYQVYVDYAVENGVIADGEYTDLSKAATRAQFASIFAKAMPKEALCAINALTDEIPDVPANAAYAKAVYLLYNAGVLTGSDKYGTFNPKSHIMRSEVSTIVTRMADESLRKTLTLSKKDETPSKDQPSAWEELTKDDGVNFDTFVTIFEDTLTYIEEAIEEIEVLLGDGETVSAATLAQLQGHISTVYTYFEVLSLNCDGYSYMEDAKELLETGMSQLEYFLDLPVPGTQDAVDAFFAEFSDCLSIISSVLSVVTDEVVSLMETAFNG